MDWDHDTRLEDGGRCLRAALSYLGLGWSVLPLCPPDHVGVGREHGRKCQSHGKAPLVPWGGLQKAPAPEEEVRRWWRQWPNANVGVVMGRVSGLVGVDVDGPAGEEKLRELCPDLPAAWVFDTPGGGRRLLFDTPGGVLLAIQKVHLARKEEVRLLGEGSQTVVPPSRHPNGKPYLWVH